MKKVQIGIGSQWLRADAAASFARMLKAGMPKAGLVVAGRTLAQQRYLYNLWKAGKGNLAAYPNANAPHIRGLAFDATRGSKMQRWLVKGGAVMSRSGSEHIQANDYGFYRTVVGEAWHFFYYPNRDRKGKAAKSTGAVNPTLRLGSKGAAVKALQGKLGIRKDGIFGPKTRQAVIRYQRGHGLAADGIVGSKTRSKLGL